MKIEETTIAGVPALVIGPPSQRVWLYVHGKMGSKDEAVDFALRACPPGAQVVGIDLPEHGSRKGSRERLLPWTAVPELQQVCLAMAERWREIRLRANSIGAWLSMQALAEQPIIQALFVSPVVDMENLIENMMTWAGVTEPQLAQQGEIPTAFGETLSWEYLCWVRAHPLGWNVPTEILYAGTDQLTPRPVMESFAAEHGCGLTVVENSEHWFHTPEQLAVLRDWEARRVGGGITTQAP